MGFGSNWWVCSYWMWQGVCCKVGLTSSASCGQGEFVSWLLVPRGLGAVGGLERFALLFTFGFAMSWSLWEE